MNSTLLSPEVSSDLRQLAPEDEIVNLLHTVGLDPEIEASTGHLEHVMDHRFKVVGRIPVSSSCEVVKAIDTDDLDNKKVALKKLHTEREADKIRAAREIKALHALKGEEGIVTLHDYGLVPTDEGLSPDLYVATELMPGTLGKFSTKSRGDAKWLVSAMVPLLHGMQTVHEKGWVHRDVKPDNIFIDQDSNCVLGDFGSVTAAGEIETVTDPVMIKKVTEGGIGTMNYLSKEGLLAKPAEPSRDMFAFGVTMFKCLTSQLPYGNSRNAVDSFKAIQTADHAPNPADYRPDLVHPDVGRVVMRLLDEPPQRPDAQEVAEVFAWAA